MRPIYKAGLFGGLLIILAGPGWSATGSAASRQVVAKAAGIATPVWPMPQVRNLPAISGLWQVPFGEGKCYERYNFTPDNRVYISSAAERLIGRYELQPLLTGEVSSLVIRVEYDNSRKDCEGKDRDQTGEVMTMSIVRSPDQQHMRWCEQNNPGNCFLELDRVLP